MKVLFLGTGTSVGVPMIGCNCAVCRSSDPKNRRLRSSIYIESGGTRIVVDTPPDFREQMLTYKPPRLDAVFFTHSHADHILGFDDIRRFNTMQGEVIPVYGHPKTLLDVRRIFDYVGKEAPQGVYRPMAEFIELGEGEHNVGDLVITPFMVEHGQKPTLGFIFKEANYKVGYAPDCRDISTGELAKLKDLDVMIIDGLRHRPHRTHFTVRESIEMLRRIGAGVSYLTHISHELDHRSAQQDLPEGVRLAYDGLCLGCVEKAAS